MNRNVIAWVSATVAIVAYIGAAIVDPWDASVVIWVPVVMLFMSVGAILWTKVPENPIGPLFLVAGTVLVAGAMLGTYGHLGSGAEPTWPASDFATAAANLGFFYAIVIALIGIPLIFPDGRLPSPRFRIIVAFVVANLLGWTLGVFAGRDTAAVAEPVVFISTIVGLIGAATAVTIRFRRGDPVARQQVKWLAANAGLAAVFFPVAFLMPDPDSAAIPAFALAMWTAAILTLLFLPIAIGIAVLRYRLFEIDRIVSRTVSYALVTVALAAVFGATVLVLSTVLARFGQSESIAVAASTLAVFAISQPVLRRVRDRVDRRFNRASYDAERTATSFATRLRDEVDITAVAADLDSTVRQAVDPRTSSLWLRASNR